MACDIRADQRGADFLRIEGGDLLVDRTDAFAFGVVQHRQVDRTGDVILGEFALGTDVDNLVKIIELCYGDRAR